MLEELVLSNTRISRDYPDPVERHELLNTALNELVENARSVYGPFCPCDELLHGEERLLKGHPKDLTGASQ